MKNLKTLEYYRQNISQMNRPTVRQSLVGDKLHPDEEDQARIFLDVIERIDSHAPSMIEIGCSSHSAYSQNFNDIFENECINICIEIIEEHLALFKYEWEQSSRTGFFYHGHCGIPTHVSEPVRAVESRGEHLKIKQLLQNHNIDILDILHMDIQGSEVSVLQEMCDDDLFDRVRYGFISVHHNHNDCITILNKQNLEYLYNSPDTGGCGDGLIVYQNKNLT